MIYCTIYYLFFILCSFFFILYSFYSFYPFYSFYSYYSYYSYSYYLFIFFDEKRGCEVEMSLGIILRFV